MMKKPERTQETRSRRTRQSGAIEPEFVRISTAAVLLDICHRKMWQLVREGAIPSYQVGRRATRVRVSEVIGYAQRQRIGESAADKIVDELLG